MDTYTGHSHPGGHNLVLNSIPDRYATVQDTGDSRKRHCNTEGKVFEFRAKTRNQIAIMKYGTIYCLGCSQMNASSCYQVTAEGYHSNPFCIACHYSMLKISAVSTVSMFLSSVLGKIQTKKILPLGKKKKKKRDELSLGFKPDHFE